MIRIRKPKRAPAVLRERGREAARRLCEQYDSSPDSYNRGAKAFASSDFDAGIYAAKAVKDALRKAQHGKYAFCESKIDHIDYGDVEHFRPKAGYRRRRTGPLVRPGYDWLAYEWSNVFFCCTLCNQRFKRNHFPLVDDARRARSRHDAIRKEQPLLIHPEVDDPAAFLEFDREYVRAIDGHPRGQATIELLGLNREEIAERRRHLLNLIRDLIACRELLARQVEESPGPEGLSRLAAVDERLGWYAKSYRSDSPEYAAMIRAALRVDASR